MRFWTVTCSELHHCIGPITSKSLATMVALVLTKKGEPDGCVYVPVQMEFLGTAIEAESAEQLEEFMKSGEKKKSKSPYIGGQYL